MHATRASRSPGCTASRATSSFAMSKWRHQGWETSWQLPPRVRTVMPWRTTTTACRAHRSSSQRTARLAWSFAARPSTTWWRAMSGEARIGLLGRGTVGGAFAELVEARADAVAEVAGSRPSIAGVLRRSEGDFDALLEGSDIVVELIGGTDPARDYVLRALEAGKHV